jgi:ABC-type glycerol-3-phosphate transport system substrate-binding protein
MKRFSIVFLALLMCMALISCGGSRQASGSSGTSDFKSPSPLYAGYDLGQPMTVSVYFFSSTEAKDLPEIIARANSDYFKPILNTEIDLIMISTADRATKYPLLLAGGDDVDIIFTAPWSYYDEESAKGSFVEMTPDFLTKWMPNVYKTQLQVSWEQCRTQGKVYGIPTSRAGWDYKFCLIREDLREKYNLPAVDSWNTLEQYEFTVSKNEAGVPGYAAAATTWELMNVYLEDRNVLLTTQPVYFAWEYKGVDPAPEDLIFLYTSPWYMDYARAMRRWMDEGVWSRNVMNNTVAVRDAFVQGKSATMFWNATLFSIGQTLESNGFGTAGFYDISPNALVRRMSFNNNMWAIASTSERQERAALVIDLMKTNNDLVWLLKGGIDGRHYIRQPNNTYVGGPDAVNYPYNFWTWALDFPQDLRQAYTATTPAQQIQIQDNLDDRTSDLNIDGFRVNLGSIQSEWAVISALVLEYRASFECGIFGNQTEAKLVEFQNKLRAAGVDRVTTLVRNDYAEYLKKFK